MSASVPQPDLPSPVDPVAPLDRTGGYLGPNPQAAVAAASRATPARWRLLLRRTTFWVGAGILVFWIVCAIFGYLIGGRVVVETLFNYQGLGLLIYKAAVAKDFAMLEAGVLIIGVVYVLATLAADLLLTALNPRLRIGGSS